VSPALGPAELLGAALRDVPVAVLDLEMTGLSPEGDRICEVAVCRGRGGVVQREFQTLVRPMVPMSKGARKCHGITDRMLFGAPVFGEIAGDVVLALQGAVVVCHNVDFDMGFLHRELDGSPTVLPPPVTLDTLLMARRLFAFRRNGLAAVAEQLQVELTDAHRALADARATFGVFARMAEILDPKGTVTVAELADLVGALAPQSALRLQQQQILRDAHRTSTPVRIGYLSTSDPSTGMVSRVVSPWFLRLPRLQGWCHLRRAERVFRLDRMREVELAPDEAFEEPPAGTEQRV
jgi:DNA polymerase III epsilon subunit family exonuclease